MAVLTGFVAVLLGGTLSAGTVNFDFQFSDTTGEITFGSSGLGFSIYEVLNYEMATMIIALLTMFALIGTIWGIATFILAGPISMGYAKYNLNLADDNDPQFSDLFSQFHRFGEGFLLNLLTNLFIILWMLLFIIPGIMAAFSYSMAPFILYENPGMTAREALGASKELMKGNRFRLFCMELSFIGWGILSVFTLGIGSLFLTPYMEAAHAVFYREIKDQKYSNPIVEGTASEEAEYTYTEI